MRTLAFASVALALASTAAAQSQESFVRPDCSPYESAFKAESRCIREIRKSWQEANFAALQKTGLMFIYMARPDIESHPDAKQAIENKIEGSFTIRFSVAKDGTVYDDKAEDVTAGIEPLAALWVDAIKQWTFAKIDEPVVGLEHRRIYMYAKEDRAESFAEAQQAP